MDLGFWPGIFIQVNDERLPNENVFGFMALPSLVNIFAAENGLRLCRCDQFNDISCVMIAENAYFVRRENY